MDSTARDTRFLDADTFLLTDQRCFGDAWRYELVRGRIVAQAAPSKEHARILANLAREIGNQLRANRDCAPEAGSGVVAERRQRDTARIPDATIRCGDLPRVLFEVISPSELAHKRDWAVKRGDLQSVAGVTDIVEIFQDEMLAHIYRKLGDQWTFEFAAGPEGAIALPGVGIVLTLGELYERVLPEG